MHLRQFHNEGGVAIQASLRIDAWTDESQTARMYVISPDGVTLTAMSKVSDGEAELHIEVENPQLWWPNGYGEQPLYAIRVHLEAGGVALDTRDYQLGLRTIELRQEGDKWGQCFAFIVNGVPVFAKGANWIPAEFISHSRQPGSTGAFDPLSRRNPPEYAAGVGWWFLRGRAFLRFMRQVRHPVSGRILSLRAAYTRWMTRVSLPT